jgi:ADP-ribosylation factor-like protein 6
VATVGFLVEKFKHGNVNFTMFDMSGQGRYRNLWYGNQEWRCSCVNSDLRPEIHDSYVLPLSPVREHYYAECEGIIFVIDSAEPVRMCVVKDELDTLLAHKDMAKNTCPILFFANKSDLPKALTPQQISEALELTKLIDRKYSITSVT